VNNLIRREIELAEKLYGRGQDTAAEYHIRKARRLRREADRGPGRSEGRRIVDGFSLREEI